VSYGPNGDGDLLDASVAAPDLSKYWAVRRTSSSAIPETRERFHTTHEAVSIRVWRGRQKNNVFATAKKIAALAPIPERQSRLRPTVRPRRRPHQAAGPRR
jgi:hypothetical protein